MDCCYYLEMWFCCCFQAKSADLSEPILYDWTNSNYSPSSTITNEETIGKTVVWTTSPIYNETYSKDEYDRTIDSEQIAKNKEDQKKKKLLSNWLKNICHNITPIRNIQTDKSKTY